MAEQVERVIISLEAEDNASEETKRLSSEINRLKQSVKDLAAEEKRLSAIEDKNEKETKDAIKLTIVLTKERKKLAEATRDLKLNIEGTTAADKAAAKQLAQQRRQLQQEGSRARLFGDVESRTRAISGGIGFAGGATGQKIERGIGFGAEGLASVEAVGLLKQELPALAAQLGLTKFSATQLKLGLGVMAAAAIAAGIAIKLISDASKEAQQSAKAQIETEKQLTALKISTLNTAEIKAEQQAIIELNEARRLERNEVARGFNTRLESLNLFQKAGEVSGLANQGLDDFQNRVTQLDTEIDASKEVWIELEAALDDTTTATNDAAAAEAKLQDERESASGRNIANLRAELSADAEAQKRAETFTQKQLDAKKSEVNAAIELEKLFQETTLTRVASGKVESEIAGKAIEDSFEKQQAFERESELLQTVVAPGVELREQEAAAIKLVNASLKLAEELARQAAKELEASFKSLTANAQQTAQDLQDFADKTADIEAKRQLGIIQDAEKAALDRTNDLADHYQDLAEIDRDFFEERGDLLDDISEDLSALDDEKLTALKDFNKTQIRDTVDHLKRLEDIRLRAQNSIRSASAKLDALGIFEAQQAAEAELKTENEKFNEEKKRRAEDFRDQVRQIAKERAETLRAGQQALRDLQRQHNRERQEAQAAFNEKIRRENQQAALESSQQQQRWALEDQQRQAQFGKEETQTIIHQENLLFITAQGMAGVETEFENTMTNLVAMAGAKTITPVGSPAANLPHGDLPAFASANTLTNGAQGVSDFRAPNAAQPSGPGALGGITIPISINGAQQPMQVAAEVRRELDNVFAGMAVG